jgi:hypothetical protein
MFMYSDLLIFSSACSQILGEISVMTMRLYALGLCLMDHKVLFLVFVWKGLGLLSICILLLKIVHGTFTIEGDQIR